MSKIALEGNVSGSGTLTIAAPNTNSNFTLSLPTNTGTIVTQNSTPAFASTIGVGGATPSTSGAGITFPAAQSASSNANTLDDYEEGTWTPALSASGATFTYAFQTGRYTKIGNTVVLHGRIILSTASGGSGVVTVTGLPFTAAPAIAGNNVGQQGIIGRSSSFAGDVPMSIEVSANTTEATPSYRTASNGATTALDFTDLGNAADFLFTVTYQAA
jgi:hypothetical protein